MFSARPPEFRFGATFRRILSVIRRHGSSRNGFSPCLGPGLFGTHLLDAKRHKDVSIRRPFSGPPSAAALARKMLFVNWKFVWIRFVDCSSSSPPSSWLPFSVPFLPFPFVLASLCDGSHQSHDVPEPLLQEPPPRCCHRAAMIARVGAFGWEPRQNSWLRVRSGGGSNNGLLFWRLAKHPCRP